MDFARGPRNNRVILLVFFAPRCKKRKALHFNARVSIEAYSCATDDLNIIEMGTNRKMVSVDKAYNVTNTGTFWPG